MRFFWWFSCFLVSVLNVKILIDCHFSLAVNIKEIRYFPYFPYFPHKNTKKNLSGQGIIYHDIRKLTATPHPLSNER
ncbi:hypothetical protein KC19_7G016200 [Ceratodon purpureus]|uniref:Secreted protein n=1 Tax=Ceratodon purpureus TaxID=3225 RepID=A0A8T0H3D4_CERPU|nr:hypothetical protein KC19_7G016200 [Ceratodon purpureus]